jgi:2-polyprenyl-3-methyl-5-hydroxy-6-metoxy-1,4-benzoquinol methylase
MKRVVVAELLDSDAGTSREVEGSLADLRMVNRFFGGVRTTRELLRRVAAERRLNNMSWLDVGGASGDIAAQVEQSMARSGITCKAAILDRAATHLNGSRSAVCGDALAIPFRDNSFDVVASSLFVHHLEPHEVARFAREGLRVARHAFIINDLMRHPLHLALIYAGYPLYRSRLTRHDAPASVRRAYTAAEITGILQSTGAGEVKIEVHYLFRLGAIAWKKQQPLSTT